MSALDCQEISSAKPRLREVLPQVGSILVLCKFLSRGCARSLGIVSSKSRIFRTAESSSVLSLHLKRSRSVRTPILIGSVQIKIQELLDRCKHHQSGRAASFPGSSSSRDTPSSGIALPLCDDGGRETITLVVKLLDITPRVDEAPAIESASHSVELRDASPPSRESARDAKGGGDDVSILHLLRELVDKTKTTANSISKTTEVRIAPPP